jgi:hypothetical protein
MGGWREEKGAAPRIAQRGAGSGGTHVTPAAWLAASFSSTSTLINVMVGYSLESASNTGPMRLQGPHHVAVKSTLRYVVVGWEAGGGCRGEPPQVEVTLKNLRSAVEGSHHSRVLL